VTRRDRVEFVAVVGGFAALTLLLTYPLGFHLGTLGRTDNGDGQFSVWNVAWVARTLVVDPLHVLDANIFYPHQWTLAYSESNLGAGLLAVPAYWVTRDALTAHNVVLLLSFVLSGACMYYLVRYLFGDRFAAIVAAIGFAYCPYVFGHLPHMQLLMTAGLPGSMLAFHRLADAPSAARGVVLGLVLGVQAFFCGYYTIFVALMTGFAVLAAATVDRRWRDAAFWRAVFTAAAVSLVVALPMLMVYAQVQSTTGFSRSLGNANAYSADMRAYLASPAYAHAWILKVIERWRESLFPGYVVTIFGVAGLATGLRSRGRARLLWAIYGGLAILAFWTSLGPPAGLYRLMYAVLPGLGLIRAPSRFGLIVTFALAVLGGGSIAALLRRLPPPALVASVLIAVAVAESVSPSSFTKAEPIEQAYNELAKLPPGPVLEIPVYSPPFAHARTQYMLSSTVHWMPLVDAYSDVIPRGFQEVSSTLAGFPSAEAFKVLARDRVRYVVFHVDTMERPVADDIQRRLKAFGQYVSRRYADDRIWLYEIVGYP